MFMLVLLLFCGISVLASPAIILNNCKIDNEDCITNAVKAAYPLVLEPNGVIRTENMDPMYQELIEGNLSIVKFKLFNTSVTGYKSCQVTGSKFIDETGDVLQINLMCPKFVLKGKYDINGKLIVIPVKGNGDYILKTKKYNITIDLYLKTITRDGKDYKNIRRFEFKAEPLENITYDLKNLFNGQKDLGDEVIKYANNNWKEVANELQDPVFYANLKKIIKNANKFLNTLSVDKYIQQ